MREAHEQIAPIIDAMESSSAQVEQLVEEMESLLVDIQSLLGTKFRLRRLAYMSAHFCPTLSFPCISLYNLVMDLVVLAT
jgi:hypothetical protein